MSEQIKRSWFRFHLSTVILLTLASGLLLWANLRAEKILIHQSVVFVENGWPYRFVSEAPSDVELASSGALNLQNARPPIEKHLVDQNRIFDLLDQNEQSKKIMLEDICICGAILCAIGLSSEFLIRRREARKR